MYFSYREILVPTRNRIFGGHSRFHTCHGSDPPELEPAVFISAGGAIFFISAGVILHVYPVY